MQLFNMSPMQLKMCAAAALFGMLAVFEIVSRARDAALVKSGRAEDLRKDDTVLKKHNMVQHSKGRIWAEGILIIATGIAVVVWVAAMLQYQSYGAFYDGSWRVPDVEDHFHFRTDDTERLQAEYDKDPENFDFSARSAIVVKLGCQDCEAVYETLDALYAAGVYDIVFSNSDIGKKYVEYFDITYVPSVTYGGNVIELRTGDAAYDDGEPVGGTAVDDIQDAADRLKEWMDSEPKGEGTGTKTGDAGLWEQRQKEEQENGGD